MFTSTASLIDAVRARNPRAVGRAISLVENGDPRAGAILAALEDPIVHAATIVGITGPGGAGKSTLTGQMIGHYRRLGRRVGVVAVDPSSPVSGGALLGDRVRMMHHATDGDVVVRSMATRGRIGGLCAAAGAAVRILALAGCDPVIIETVGVGQAEIDVVRLADLTALVMAPGLGDDIQAMKAGLVELADILVVNKGDHPQAEALMAEMEPVARERGRRLVRTIATAGEGISDLAAAIATTADSHRASGEQQRRRQANREAEAVDWALEMLRPVARAAVRRAIGTNIDPRAAARHALHQILGRDIDVADQAAEPTFRRAPPIEMPGPSANCCLSQIA
jgi:LAO/AO transport system kinase